MQTDMPNKRDFRTPVASAEEWNAAGEAARQQSMGEGHGAMQAARMMDGIAPAVIKANPWAGLALGVIRNIAAGWAIADNGDSLHGVATAFLGHPAQEGGNMMKGKPAGEAFAGMLPLIQTGISAARAGKKPSQPPAVSSQSQAQIEAQGEVTS